MLLPQLFDSKGFNAAGSFEKCLMHVCFPPRGLLSSGQQGIDLVNKYLITVNYLKISRITLRFSCLSRSYILLYLNFKSVHFSTFSFIYLRFRMSTCLVGVRTQLAWQLQFLQTQEIIS